MNDRPRTSDDGTNRLNTAPAPASAAPVRNQPDTPSRPTPAATVSSDSARASASAFAARVQAEQ